MKAGPTREKKRKKGEKKHREKPSHTAYPEQKGGTLKNWRQERATQDKKSICGKKGERRDRGNRSTERSVPPHRNEKKTKPGGVKPAMQQKNKGRGGQRGSGKGGRKVLLIGNQFTEREKKGERRPVSQTTKKTYGKNRDELGIYPVK